MPLEAPAGRIGAVVLAAGRSQRMGTVKMTLPWGETTVVGRVVSVLAQAGVGEIVVVTGSNRLEVEAAIDGLPARPVHNPHYAKDYMLLTLQAGMDALSPAVDACLVALGDGPQIEARIVLQVIDTYVRGGGPLVVPSYQMRRGHPWLVARPLWVDLLRREPPETPRAFLNAHAEQITYVEVDSDSILRDLDTPDDYARERPPG